MMLMLISNIGKLEEKVAVMELDVVSLKQEQEAVQGLKDRITYLKNKNKELLIKAKVTRLHLPYISPSFHYSMTY